MDGETGVRKRREDLRRVLRKLEVLLAQSDTLVDELAAAAPTGKDLAALERLRVDVAQSAKEYIDQQAAFSEYVQGQLRMIEEARAAAAMPKKTAKTGTRDEARIQELSETLTRDLRLQRVDGAIKELLDFLSDAEFFAANASTGRKRKLRTLQNAIEKALEK